VAIADFERLFGSGGLLDEFFNKNLSRFVDVRARPWQWKVVNGVDLGISPQVLQQFQYAAEIRETFFNGSSVSISFQITPFNLDPKAQAMSLIIDGNEVNFSHRNQQPTPARIDWPGDVGVARLTFIGAPEGVDASISRDGPWAWFRLLDTANKRKTSVSDRIRFSCPKSF